MDAWRCFAKLRVLTICLWNPTSLQQLYQKFRHRHLNHSSRMITVSITLETQSYWCSFFSCGSWKLLSPEVGDADLSICSTPERKTTKQPIRNLVKLLQNVGGTYTPKLRIIRSRKAALLTTHSQAGRLQLLECDSLPRRQLRQPSIYRLQNVCTHRCFLFSRVIFLGSGNIVVAMKVFKNLVNFFRYRRQPIDMWFDVCIPF